MENQAELIEPVDVDMVDFTRTGSKDNEQSSEKFFYTINAPKSFRAHSDYTVNLTIHDLKSELDEAVVVRVSIEDEDDETGLNIHQDVTMKPNVTQTASLAVGDVSLDSNYKLVVKGVSGITLEREASLDLQQQTHAILIQTDKAIYKPMDCIKFRVLVLDSHLKAAIVAKNELNISFIDSCRNTLKVWNGVNTINGVFSGEFQLSDLPNFGEWKINAAVGDQVKIAIIEVAEYVLPKFSTSIESADHFCIEDEKVRVVIRAKYTHGKPLKGTAIVTVTEEDNFGYFRYRKESLEKEEEQLVQKSFAIDGQETVELDIKNELKFDRNHDDPYSDVKNFKIKTQVTESLTGLQQSAEKTIKIHKRTYEVSTDLTNAAVKRESTIDINISVRRKDGSVVRFVDPNKKKITIIREQFYADVDESTKQETIFDLDENGDVFTTFDIAKNESSFSLKAKFGTEETDLGIFYTTPNTVADKINLNAKNLTEKCCINKEIEIEVMSHYPFPSYTYLIVGRGKILETKTITPAFDDSENSEYIHRFSFLPNFDYAPLATVIVYCVRNDSIVSTSLNVELYDDFKNFIDLNVSTDKAKPGDVVDVKVTSNPKSYIGLLGIDQSVLLLRGGNDLARDEIWNELEMFHSNVKIRSHNHVQKKKKIMPFYNNEWKDFANAGLITFSNTNEPLHVQICYRLMACSAMNRTSCFADPNSVKPIIRKDFPETWIWDSVDDRSFTGFLNLKKKVPDSLTTWVLTGFSIDPENGLAITKAPSKLCVQQEFHISLNLPYSVKRGEIITIPCSIFNYLPNDIETEVTLEGNNEFEFVDSAVNDSIYPEIKDIQYRKKKLMIRADDALNALFTIRPTKVGLISLKVSAVSPTASDCVIKTLNVECEGVPQFENKALFIDLRGKSQIEPIEIPIEIPKIALPDSARIEITCVGDLLGGTIKNLQQLIRLPYGCGEQNMLNFVPNIVVLNYLKNTHQLTPEIECLAKKYMEIGYQRELSYKHKDGSFSAFGESDKCGSTWLTAFVAKSFQQAADHIAIQEDVVDEALKWISEAQSPDGSFAEKGSVCHKEMQSGSSNGVALTAYVLTAFLVNTKSKTTYETTIQKAIKNIIESVKDCSDVYALAICAYALQKADHVAKTTVLDRLNESAKSNDNHKWWDKSLELKDSCFKESKTLNVEVTAYALLTLLSSIENDSECLPIVKWLLNQRNDQGGFEGTQDTIIGIEALADFAVKIATKECNLKIDVNTSNGMKHSFDVNKGNSLVLQSHKLMPDEKKININASGKGFSLLELSCRYNINTPLTKSAFSLQPNVEILNDDHMRLQITASYQAPKGKDLVKQSNMAVMEISMPSGFVVNTELLDGLKTSLPTIKRIDTKNGETMAIVYFDHLTAEPITLKVDGFREHFIDGQKPVPIVIYDYYDNALRAGEFYSLKATSD